MSDDKTSDVSDLREQLRELGYLDSRIERFFLKGSSNAQGFAAAVFGNAWKLALAGGILLAAPLLLGTLGAVPELVQDPIELLVLGFYCLAGASLVIFFTAMAGGAFFLLCHGLGGLGRVSPLKLSRGVGAGLGLFCLAYLTLWWRARMEASLLWGFSFGLGVFASLALGRLAGLAALGVLTQIRNDRPMDGSRLTERRWTGYVFLGACLYAVLFLTLGRVGNETRVPPPSPYRIEPSPYRVLFLGIDGLSLSTIETLTARGELPAFEALRRRGGWAPLTRPLETVPAVLWTSIATGQEPSRHGIQSVSGERMPGLRTSFQQNILAKLGALFRLTEPRPVGTGSRRVKAIWDILSDQGRPVGVVGWWASWPASTSRGFLVSDRLFFKLRQGGEFERETDSPELYRRLASSFEDDLAAASSDLGAIVSAARELGGDELAVAFQRDSYHLRLGERLRREETTALYMMYLSAMDVTSMKLLRVPSKEVATTIASTSLIQDYARWLDERLMEFLEGLHPEDGLMVVAEPGRYGGPENAEGVLFLTGGPAVDTGRLREASIYDVTPTLLHLLGFPSSDEMGGGVFMEAFVEEWARAHPATRIGTFGGRRLDLRVLAPSGFDEEMIRNLRALGYIE